LFRDVVHAQLQPALNAYRGDGFDPPLINRRQAPDAFRTGHYALGNVLYTPVQNVLVGGELRWGRRENFSDGFESDGFKLQFSFRYNFSWTLGG
jgi:hypothetical protein